MPINIKRRPIYLLRHAHSEFQQVFEETGIDPGIIDARLSPTGAGQIQQLQERRGLPKFDLIVSSPLSRCLDTSLALQSTQPTTPISVDPLLRERLGDMCDVGKPASTLAVEYPTLDFSVLAEVWWHQGPVNSDGVAIEPRDLLAARVTKFRDWLDSSSDQTIAVVSHSGFLKRLIGTSLPNCELFEWDLSNEPKKFAAT